MGTLFHKSEILNPKSCDKPFFWGRQSDRPALFCKIGPGVFNKNNFSFQPISIDGNTDGSVTYTPKKKTTVIPNNCQSNYVQCLLLKEWRSSSTVQKFAQHIISNSHNAGACDPAVLVLVGSINPQANAPALPDVSTLLFA